ncbi:hypothetical protein QQY66_28505 [Streptomyces sp. DG2A-72]|uniref:hypothetical protein n=1 Tax=Streptomyces sp. DG2A-72 TaxID=3051386 RepID=UPI00265C780B|nr:hypothetical protein [Streptomyces sp. DG2A-72]MDO0935418.1 hypothetical protein [Streptomyces sp. DG2A-72]
MTAADKARVIRVVVVDDEALVRSGFQLILGGTFESGPAPGGGYEVTLRLPAHGDA